MADKVKIIGDRILSMDDLDKMNQAEIRSRKYKFCTIDCGEYGKFLAKVEYSERYGIWYVTEVKYGDDWISIDRFDSTLEGGCYSCENFRLTE